jgi:hypothetical protein
MSSIVVQLSSMVKKIAFRFLIIVVAAVGILASLHNYYVRSEANGRLFWNNGQAFVFVELARYGYRVSYLRYPIEVIKEALRGVPLPDDTSFSTVVLQVTPDTVQQYVSDKVHLGEFNVVGGKLYSRDPDTGVLMKWTGKDFEPADAQEKQSVQVALHEDKVPAGPSFDNFEGWSKRTLGGEVIRESPTAYIERDSKAVVKLVGKPFTFTMNSGFITHQAYIDLARPGQAPQRIWHLNEQPHRVSKAEYERTFWRH